MSETKDYIAKVKIIDRQRKPPELAFTNTKERINWTEIIDADGFENETAVELAIIMELSKVWSSKIYDFEVISIKEKLIQVPKLILPGG